MSPLGCQGKTPNETGTSITSTTTGVGQLNALDVSLSEVVSTVVWVEWSTDAAGAGWVEYGLGDLAKRTPIDASAAEHRVAVLGLKAGHEYDLRAVTELDDGTQLVSDVVAVTPIGPTSLNDVVITEYDPELVHSKDAYFAVAMLRFPSQGNSMLLIIDREGDVVWFMEAANDLTINNPKVSADGTALIWAEWDRPKQEDKGRIKRMSLDGETLTEMNAPFAHHDFIEHADGTVGFLSHEIRDLGNPRMVLTDSIIENEMGSENDGTTIFSFFDDYLVPFYIPCEHAEGTTDHWGLEGDDEWTHSNSLMYDANDDTYIVAPRYLDSLVKFDRSTGNIIWQMGGEFGDFAKTDGTPAFIGTALPQLWSHGHMSHMWDGGFMYYDNGQHYSPKVSKISEYAYDEQAMTIEEVWSFTDGRYMDFLSDARKLNNGNVFIVSSPIGEMMEIQQDGTVVWRSTLSDVKYGRATYISDLYDLKSSLMYE